MSDIIAALSGGRLPAAIGIVRLSGDGAEEALRRVFVPSGGLESGKMTYGRLLARDGETIDRCLACFYRGPKSYTGEDMAEIFCHGSEAVAAAALRALYAAGARPAEAGEFTKRAFLNGKMDLSQAEAVADLIDARTERAAKNAAALLGGEISRRLGAMREDILGLVAHFYAVCDYSDEDIEPFEYEAAREKLNTICNNLAELHEGYLRSALINEGVPVAVIGRPNVGKSSLFNALSGFDRAIVTGEAGTTRDVITQRINIDGIDFNLMDTAGIREAESEAESLGVGRSLDALRGAELILAVFDGSRPPTAEDMEIAELCRGRKALAILNKSDLGAAEIGGLEDIFGNICRASALTGAGIEEVTAFLTDNAPDPGVVVTGERQAALIASAREALAAAAQSAELGMTADAFLLDAERGARLLGQATGADADPDIAAAIFGRFCVGK